MWDWSGSSKTIEQLLNLELHTLLSMSEIVRVVHRYVAPNSVDVLIGVSILTHFNTLFFFFFLL